MNPQQLLHITKIEVAHLNSAKIRGVSAEWENNKAIISFYYDGEISEEDIELASDACGEIIAHFPNGLLEENYIRLDYPLPLPSDSVFAYKRDEK